MFSESNGDKKRGDQPIFRPTSKFTQDASPGRCKFQDQIVPNSSAEHEIAGAKETTDVENHGQTQGTWSINGMYGMFSTSMLGCRSPKSSVWMRCSNKNQPFWGSPIYGNHHIPIGPMPSSRSMPCASDSAASSKARSGAAGPVGAARGHHVPKERVILKDHFYWKNFVFFSLAVYVYHCFFRDKVLFARCY